MERIAIFIDGGYINKILRNYFNKQNIDYLKFSEVLCSIVKLNRLRTYFYHSLPIVRKGNKDDELKLANMQRFLSNLKRLPRFEVKLGKLQLIGNQFKQKMVDVLMSLDIVDVCFDKQVQEVIIVAGDADFVPAIKKAKDYGAVVHLFYHQKSVQNELLDIVDELHIINDNLINCCKHLK